MSEKVTEAKALRAAKRAVALFHGTTRKDADLLLTAGDAKNLYLTTDEWTAAYYAHRRSRERGGEPVVVTFDGKTLRRLGSFRGDFNSDEREYEIGQFRYTGPVSHAVQSVEPAGDLEKNAMHRNPRSLGKKTAPMLKFRHADTPRSAREFKRKYPAEFEALKGATGGRDFSDEMLEKLRDEYEGPVEWVLVEDEFEVDSAIEGLRRFLRYYPEAPNREWVRERMNALIAKGPLCDEPNRVLKLCVDYAYLGVNARQERILGALTQSAEASGHPSEPAPLHCIGWVRWCEKPGVWVVEEVQSDVMGARRGLADPFMQAQLRAGGLEPREVAAVLDKLTPWHERFYEDALGFLLERAAEAGVEVEMVDYSYKQDEESPRSVYTDLPRSMGMRLSDGSEMEKLDKSWKIRPNRRRRTAGPIR